MDKTKMSFGARTKESCRKMLVSLKHKPQTIPMVVLAVTFLYYAFNLTHISHATSMVNKFPMGLCGFIAMLFSMLSLVCFMNSFPNRKPVNKPMLCLMFLMLIAVFISDVVYIQTILTSVNAANSTIRITPSKADIINPALRTLWVHAIMLIVSALVTILLPIYSKWIRKINTSIEVEAGKEMGAIGGSGDD